MPDAQTLTRSFDYTLAGFAQDDTRSVNSSNRSRLSSVGSQSRSFVSSTLISLNHCLLTSAYFLLLTSY